jgi:hypothetical protein
MRSQRQISAAPRPTHRKVTLATPPIAALPDSRVEALAELWCDVFLAALHRAKTRRDQSAAR